MDFQPVFCCAASDLSGAEAWGDELSRRAGDFVLLGTWLRHSELKRLSTSRTVWKQAVATARDWGLFIATGIKDDQQAYFSVQSLFFVEPDGTLYAAYLQTLPFARRTFRTCLRQSSLSPSQQARARRSRARRGIVFYRCASRACNGRWVGQWAAAYVARVRITVRAEGTTIVREGFGAGEAFAATPGQAHERAVKTAETDATKRALTTFGNCFGLALYQDKTATAIGSTNREEKAESATVQSPSNDLSQPTSVVIAETSPCPSDARAEAAGEEAAPPDRLRREPAAENPRKAHQAAQTSESCRVAKRYYLTGTGQIVPRPASSPPIPSLIDKSELLLGEPKRIRNSE